MYLGLNLGRTSFGKILKDGSSALITEDGRTLRHISEERVRQLKAYGGYKESLNELFEIFACDSADIEKVTITNCCELYDLNLKINVSFDDESKQYCIPHHYSHALYSFVLSGFNKALICVWDCGGNSFERPVKDEWWTVPREQATYYLASSSNIEKIGADFFEPYDVGFGEIYRSLTYLLGFNSYIHSTKAMSLTSFGDRSRWLDKCIFKFEKGKISNDFVYNPKDKYEYLIKYAEDDLGIKISPVKQQKDLENKNLLDFAAYIQRSMETVAIKKINYLIDNYNCRNVCLAGGVALNSVMNSKIRINSNCSDIFVPPACGDMGQSIGNAINSYHVSKGAFPSIEEHVYIGSDCKIDGSVLNKELETNNFKLVSDEQKLKLASRLLAAGEIIGWCQGHSESGPRALGNRSILCRPDDKGIEEKLRILKGRNWFEPFAASILESYVKDYFPNANRQPYMLETSRVADKYLDVISPCLHMVDKTSRIQTVNPNDNKIFYDLIENFYKRVGFPLLLNTSLNQRGFPIAETGEDAINFFKSTHLEFLFLDNYLLYKPKREDTVQDLTTMEQDLLSQSL